MVLVIVIDSQSINSNILSQCWGNSNCIWP